MAHDRQRKGCSPSLAKLMSVGGRNMHWWRLRAGLSVQRKRGGGRGWSHMGFNT